MTSLEALCGKVHQVRHPGGVGRMTSLEALCGKVLRHRWERVGRMYHNLELVPLYRCTVCGAREVRA